MKLKLFVLWMLTSMTFVTFYSGVITSAVIKPRPDLVMEIFGELEQYNYGMLFNKR